MQEKVEFSRNFLIFLAELPQEKDGIRIPPDVTTAPVFVHSHFFLIF
jgi:hypothetical protein